ncbi:MAG: hypothetical protein ACJAV1_002357 [Paraglaciecola sp.]|jgi:hypothetical protein
MSKIKVGEDDDNNRAPCYIKSERVIQARFNKPLNLTCPLHPDTP